MFCINLSNECRIWRTCMYIGSPLRYIGQQWLPCPCVYAQSQPASPPPKSRGTRAAEAGACKASGPSCEGCDRLVICANTGNRVLTAIANISCSEIAPEMTCSKASCTTQAAATQNCDGSEQAGAFRCLQPGFFPDPTSCKLFHVCSTDLSHFSGKQPLCSDVRRLFSFSLI